VYGPRADTLALVPLKKLGAIALGLRGVVRKQHRSEQGAADIPMVHGQWNYFWILGAALTSAAARGHADFSLLIWRIRYVSHVYL
jgi:hypothetical protein